MNLFYDAQDDDKQFKEWLQDWRNRMATLFIKINQESKNKDNDALTRLTGLLLWFPAKWRSCSCA